jgi:dUTP pyrophosphatase
MKRYMRRKENKELYEIIEEGQVRLGEKRWARGISYRKVVPTTGLNVFYRDTDSVVESFVLLKTIECSHRLVSYDLIYDPRFPVERATTRSVGVDIRATENFSLMVGERKKIPTGVSWNVRRVDPEYCAELQVRPRSGHADKQGLSMVNCVGTIDEDYKGEIHAILINLGQEMIHMKAGDKIAQLILGLSADTEGQDEITIERQRGAGGFGSTDCQELYHSPECLAWINTVGEGMRYSNCFAAAKFLLVNGIAKAAVPGILMVQNTALSNQDVIAIVNEAAQMVKTEARFGEKE